jgi:hypothetical protein
MTGTSAEGLVMATKTKSPPPTSPPLSEAELLEGLYPALPLTTESRLECIAALAAKIKEYIRFICKAGSLKGTSSEAKDKAVTAFYEQMVVVERQLGRIHEDLRLG